MLFLQKGYSMKHIENQNTSEKDCSLSKEKTEQIKMQRHDTTSRRRDPYHIDSWYDENNIYKVRDLNNIRMYG